MPSERNDGGDTPMLDAICDDFEQARRAGDKSPLQKWLPDEPTLAEAVLVELVRIELQLRLSSGHAARAEQYLARFPQLAADLNKVMRIVTAEFEQRRRKEWDLSADDYRARFPQLASHPDWNELFGRGTSSPASGTSTEFQQLPASTAAGRGLPRLPGYQVLEELGRGGMGIVYKAMQAGTQRLVALKMIRSGLVASREETLRLRAEAKAVARLQHPNIVQIHQVSEHEGQIFLALEFADGGTLAQRLAGNPQPARIAAALTETLARAMQHAHEQDIVHRDLKPANVLLASGGREPADGGEATEDAATDGKSSDQLRFTLSDFVPKITDFGLAKRLDQSTLQTQSGAVMGTPSYMAPEQADGKVRDIGPTTDVYALGAVLYELLTGRPPFRGAAILDTLQQVIADEPVPPSRLQPRLPRDLETICLKCLAKEPGHRYPTALALADDLQRFRAGEPILARPSGWLERTAKWARRRPAQAALAVLSLLLLVAVAAGGVGLFAYQAISAAKESAELQRDKAQTQRERAETAEKKLEKETYYGWVQRALSEWKLGGAIPAQKLLDQCKHDLRGWEYHYVQRLCRDRKLTIKTDTGQFTRVCFSPDGQWLAGGRALIEGKLEGSVPGQIQLWDGRTGKPGLSIDSPAGPITSLSFSADSKRILAVSSPKTVKVWDTKTGRQELTFDTDSVASVRFSPDGQRIAGSCQGQPVKFWDARTGKELLAVAGPSPPIITDLSFSSDGKRLAGACINEGIRIWDADSGKELLAIKDVAGSVTRVCFSPDGANIAGAGAFQAGDLINAVKLWDAGTGKELRTLRGHADSITGISFRPDGQRLASVSGDQVAPVNMVREVKVWDTRTGEEVFAHKGHCSGLWDVCFSPDGQRLATVGSTWDELGGHDLRKGEVRVWDADVGQEALTFRGGLGPIAQASFSFDGKQVAGLYLGEESVRIWDSWTGKESVPLKLHGPIVSACFSPAGPLIATSGEDQLVTIWDATTRRRLATAKKTTGPVADLRFSPDGRRIAGIVGEPGLPDKPGVAKIWDVQTMAELVSISGHSAQITEVCFSPNGDRIASAGRDGLAIVWDARTGQQTLSFQGPAGHCHAVRFSPDGQQLVTGHSDKTVRLWEATTGQEVLILKGHFGSVLCVGFSSDGVRIVSGSSDQTVRVWDARTGQEALTLKGHVKDINSVNFSPDGNRLASASLDQTVKIWDGRPQQ